ncbi:MAG: MerR family transcriptional regulator [Candidatus Cloacimonadaceae bacterium]|jgi:DNA-binding transcriptional MerR regulator|nr:MerR family transcriptional regulator [Candidatus Cloacimonadota bacterium]MDY0128089.1 MerR family transcriptional regulator [Candidatus Cloacimonadaceae bacterium]MCB5254135.1 MerR family transcriptional regulator [Candidatus Cloacimonadota bacterium]MCK9178389.1 MerR family transcriptional regulator [Candidatus Cloacimonadota bacterium]MCK9242652.1 MerR family transcriptional regulator [Candidatus Cloacimonadota bacterium]
MTKHYYSIGEVSNLLEVEPHVLRYWESEIPMIRPKRNKHQRRYTLQQIETLKTIKDLLYNQRYTIEGARQKLKQDKSLTREARAEAIAKQKLRIDAAMPAIATELKELRDQLLRLKQDCKKITGHK